MNVAQFRNFKNVLSALVGTVNTSSSMMSPLQTCSRESGGCFVPVLWLCFGTSSVKKALKVTLFCQLTPIY